MANPPDEAPPGNPRLCKRCGQAVELTTILPRFGEQPKYSIFQCAACGCMDWVAEQIGSA